MNGRKLYREYAQSKGKQAIGFKEIIKDYDGVATLTTYDSVGVEEKLIFSYQDLVNWIIRYK